MPGNGSGRSRGSLPSVLHIEARHRRWWPLFRTLLTTASCLIQRPTRVVLSTGLCSMLPPMSTPQLYDAKTLLDRLTKPHPRRPYVFLFGSALTAPCENVAGVPGVDGVVDLIREHYQRHYPSAVDTLNIALAGARNRYQAAFSDLLGRGGVDDADSIIRQAVLKAYSGLPASDPHNLESCKAAERCMKDWAVSPWLHALGRLLATRPVQLANLVLTTNFDPLIQVAIERAGGQHRTSVLSRDGRLGQNHGSGTHVVHIHGHWIASDLLHTQWQIKQPRPLLRDALRQIQEDLAIVAVGYGGWDDVFLQSLTELLKHGAGRAELLWAFYEDDEAKIRKNYATLLRKLKPGLDLGHVALYRGVDLRCLLPALCERLVPGGSDAPELHSASLSAPSPAHANLGKSASGPECEANALLEPNGFALLHNPGENFVGREKELQELKKVLLGPQMCVGMITGPGGIGKSSLLFRLWEQHADQFKSSLCIDCSSVSSPADLLARVSDWLLGQGSLQRQQLLQHGEHAFRQRALVVARALEDEGPYLLVLDAFESTLSTPTPAGTPEPLTERPEALLALLAGGLRKSKILIATRTRFALSGVRADRIHRVSLPELSEEQGVRLMKSMPRLGQVGTEEDYQELYLDGVRSPALIDLIEAEMQDYDLTAIKASVRERLHGAMVESQSLERIYARLPVAAQVLLRRASVYGEPVLLDMLAALLEQSAQEIHGSLKPLIDRSLIDALDVTLEQNGHKLYRMHEITRQWADRKLAQEEGEDGVRQARRRGGYAYLQQLPRFSLRRVPRVAFPGWHLLHTADDVGAAARLALTMAPALIRQLQPEMAQTLIEETLRVVEGRAQHLRLEARCQYQLSFNDMRRGQRAAARRRLERCHKVSSRSGDHLLEAASLCQLGHIEFREGRLESAAEFTERSLAIYRQSGDRRDIASALVSLAPLKQALLDFVGALHHYVEAIQLTPNFWNFDAGFAPSQPFEPAVDPEQILHKALGLFQQLQDASFVMELSGRLIELLMVPLMVPAVLPEAQGLWPLINTVNKVLLALAAHHEDINAMSQHLAIRAVFERRDGNYDAAKKLFQESIEISMKQGELLAAASKVALLAETEQNNGRLQEARAWFQKYFEITSQLGAPANIMSIFCRHGLAQVERSLGDLAHARISCMRALTDCQHMPSAQRPIVEGFQQRIQRLLCELDDVAQESTASP